MTKDRLQSLQAIRGLAFSFIFLSPVELPQARLVCLCS